ncbi:M48 family metallopeptidase [Micromonospora soli]|uniref:M48 family metallopeptidase n=1 Tax=Micromonospora sp. NBRC 110009 TaxID=3061627 RepID=UPI0026737F87|nr:M48 family metallopeptidase [Micromonospora sp. NBRC 110009]WKT96998.1 M48 family metallopeptidase [Micromonospora sp. NBRC 110009]
MPTKTTTPSKCPMCAQDLVLVDAGALFWCPTCRWNLDVYDPALAPWRGTRIIGRWGFRRGLELDRAAHEELLADPDVAPAGTSSGEVWLLAVSVVLALLGMAAVGYLGWLVVASDLPPGVRLALAIPAVLVLLLVKPSFGRVPKYGVISEREAPQLHRLVREVADAAGTPVPDVICADLSLNAGVARLGWRQRSVLVIGIPLWVMLPRPARVSLLAHELGHLANGDPLRVRRTLPARTFGTRAVAATGGRNPWRRAVRAANSLAEQRSGTVVLLGMVVHGVLALANVAGATAQLLVDSVAMPDSRRAEYRADLIARRIAGTGPFLRSSETVLLAGRIWQDLWHLAPRIDGEQLEPMAAEARQRLAAHLPLARQLSRRTTDLWSTHPSEDQRMRLIEALPGVDGALCVDDNRWAEIDIELAPWRRAAHNALLGTRDRF